MTNNDDVMTDRRSQLARRLMDLSLLAIFFFAPLVMGGRHPVGRLALMIATVPGTVGLILMLLSGRTVPLTWIQIVLLSLCVLIPVIQVAPLDSQWVDYAAPGLEQLFENDAPLVAQSRLHSSLSISTVTTQRSIALVITYLCIFAIVICRLDTRADVERLLLLIMSSALMLATVALLQWQYGNGRFLWLYDHPSRDPGAAPRGPFQNENHLSSLLATSLPVVLYFLFRLGPTVRPASQPSSQLILPTDLALVWWQRLRATEYSRLIAAVAGVVTVCTVYATPSRGGALLVACAAMIWVICLGWRWLGIHYAHRFALQKWLNLGTAACLPAFVIALVVLYQQIEHFSYWRAKIWAVDIAIWKDFPLLGIGVGNHGNVYRAYLDEYFPMTFSTGESSWMQLLVETGSVGVLLGLILAMIVIHTLLRALADQRHLVPPSLIGAVLAGLVASCLHAIGDFPWHIPACFVVVLALAAVAMRLPDVCRLPGAQRTPKRQAVAGFSLVLGALLLVGNLWAVSQAIPKAQASQSWDAYRRLVRDHQEDARDDDFAEEFALLQTTLRHDPHHLLARTKLIHYLTAKLERQRFEMKSPRPLAKHILAQSALLASLCPAESRSYLYAASAINVLQAPIEQQQRLLAQSQRLRVVDGQVALRMGLNALMMQDKAMEDRQFSIALESDPSCREQVLATLSMLYSVEEIVRRWDPSREPSAILFRIACEQGSDEQKLLVGRHYCQRLMEDAKECNNIVDEEHLLSATYLAACQIGDRALMLELLTRRIELQPRNIALLLARADLYMHTAALQQASADIARCRKISPLDSRVREAALQLDRVSSQIRR